MVNSNLSYAPVFISVYNRVEHFKNCLISLSQCEGSENTIVYITSDAANCEEDESNVKEIRKFISNFKGFKKIIPVFSKKNTKGKIIRETYHKIFNDHDTLIRSEDDNIFSRDFLVFINKGLIAYKNFENIFSISGYNYPISIPDNYLYNTYIWKGFSAWGVGIWKDKWMKFDWNIEKALMDIENFLKISYNVKKMNGIANHYLPALLKMLRSNVLHGDGYICMNMIKNDLYSVFPVISRVRNMGNDGSGINCKRLKNDIFTFQDIYQGDTTYEIPIITCSDSQINKELYCYFKSSYISNVKSLFELFLLRSGKFNLAKKLFS